MEDTMKKMEDSRTEQASGGNGVYDGNPLMGMLDMYYRMAMEETNPELKADAARRYNQTLDQLMSQSVNCAGYRHIPM